MVITSTNNAKIQYVKSLLLHKNRLKYKQFLVEGKISVVDMLSSYTLSQVLLLEDVFESCQELHKYNESVVLCSRQVINYITDTVNTQGIVGVFDIPVTVDINSDKIVFLDNIQDPGNLGTIVRSAAAFGYRDVILRNCVDVYNPKVVRSSMSGLRFCNISTDISIDDIVKKGYKIICADIDGIDINRYKNDSIDKATIKVCLVIGNEASGISDYVISKAHIKLRIPISNIDSLNASVAAGIFMAVL